MKLEDFHYFISENAVGGPNTPAGSEKPWLVFLHGLLGSAANWRRVTPAFEKDFRVLTFDQRGHGRSIKPATGYDPTDFANDLNFITGELGIENFSLVGHSMGGRNAFSFAARYPTQVKKLVIEDIGPMAAPLTAIDEVAGAQDEGLRDKRGPGLIEMLENVPVPFSNKVKAKEYFLNDFGDPKFGGYLYTNIKVLEDGRATWNFDLNTIVEIIEKGRGKNRWQEIEALSCPTLLLRGEFSEELDRNEFNEMLARNSCIRGVEIAGSGHWIHSDQPEKFIHVVRQFLLR